MFKDIFGETPWTGVLDFLADHPDSEYSITEIVDKSGISRPTVYKIIDDLLHKKMVIKTRTVGNTPLYRLDTDNTLVRKMLKFDFEIAAQIAEIESQQMHKDRRRTLVKAPVSLKSSS